MPDSAVFIEIDLGLARDQGPHPTCLSFAVSDIHRVVRDPKELLSPESLHRQASLRACRPVAYALTIDAAIDSLALDGQASELDWPYRSENPLNASCEFHQAHVMDKPFDGSTVERSLKCGRAIGLVINIDAPFFACTGLAPLDLLNNAKIEGRHAVVICGLRPSGGSYEYSIKNSWGEGWGTRGYAWLTAKYILARSPRLIWI
ncbi:C1 family peptidase [Sphingobium sp. CR2-8]|uniref:C1 family peptidase n=1 Tax=Sphingobium sp. CR2-8 TaxID=1306534 RepID=UPI003FA374BA